MAIYTNKSCEAQHIPTVSVNFFFESIEKGYDGTQGIFSIFSLTQATDTSNVSLLQDRQIELIIFYIHLKHMIFITELSFILYISLIDSFSICSN